jgi:hypothetical protein
MFSSGCSLCGTQSGIIHEWSILGQWYWTNLIALERN